jgi:hypothetical protein
MLLINSEFLWLRDTVQSFFFGKILSFYLVQVLERFSLLGLVAHGNITC